MLLHPDRFSPLRQPACIEWLIYRLERRFCRVDRSPALRTREPPFHKELRIEHRTRVFEIETARLGFCVRMAPRMTIERQSPVIAIYPGSFDPVTCGHLDLITRGSGIFDQICVAVAQNVGKDPLFSVQERVEMLEAVTFKMKNVSVDSFDGLLIDFAREKRAQIILRGIRLVSDYEYELQMAWMNRKMEPDIETVFMLPAEAHSYLSSSLVKEIARLGGPVKDLVPPLVEERLKSKVSSPAP